MDDDLTFQRLIEIQDEICSLEESNVGACECDKHLEIKIRHIGGGKHYVRQCNACGEQRGGALKPEDAIEQLSGHLPRAFDSAIEVARRANIQRISELRNEASRLRLMLYEQPDWTVLQAAERVKRELAAADFSKHVSGLVEQFGISDAVGFLIRETVLLKKRAHDDSKQTVNRFTCEAELKGWFESYFSKDFEIFPEVSGRHLAEDVPVCIDYILKARNHLLAAGFDARPFGVEVKYFNQEDGFTRKISRGLWQTISYNDSKFNVEGILHKPKFSLVFSNLSFADELRMVKSYGFEYENDKIAWSGMLHLANHANVGCLDVKGTRDQYQGWAVRFVGGVYFSCSVYKGKPTYCKSNENVINKVRIGNF